MNPTIAADATSMILAAGEQAGDGSVDILGVLTAAAVVLAILVPIVLFIAALVSVLRSPRLAAAGKAVWVLLTFAFPILGPIVWFIWGAQLLLREAVLRTDPGPAAPVTS